MDILNARLEALERNVYSAENRAATGNLVEQVAEIELQLSKTLSENASLAQGLEKYEKLRGTIDGDGDLELNRQMLGIAAKTELILLNDSALHTITDLRTIGDLQAKANQPEYAAAAELLPRLQQSLEPQHESQVADFRKVVDDISSIVDRYHSETEALSEMFVQWDQILTGIERKVLELESASS
ncbi:hypothetical protein GGF37_005195 [Kickxella alabastrina]|nr:hypothetical protein GGF37_005195 [Kickxella alabastrina]